MLYVIARLTLDQTWFKPITMCIFLFSKGNRNRIDAIVELLRQQQMKSYTISKMSKSIQYLSLKKVELAKNLALVSANSDIDAIRAQTANEIDLLPAMVVNSDNLPAFSVVLREVDRLTNASYNSQKSLLALEIMDDAFFRNTLVLFDPRNYLEFIELDEMIKMTSKYSATLNVLLTNGVNGLVYTKLHSHELLVFWISCCLLHREAVREHPMLNDYGIPLRFADLKHVVTDDERAVNAVKQLAKYTQTWRKLPGVTLFSLRADERDATCKFAFNFAVEDSGMFARWKRESELASQREDAHWEAVCAKKEKATQLRKDIGVEEARISKLREEIHEMMDDDDENSVSDDFFYLFHLAQNKLAVRT
jgi:hypothetical protein